jgi:polyhydroxyalkanoate synthase
MEPKVETEQRKQRSQRTEPSVRAGANAALDVMLTDAAGAQGRAGRFLAPAATAQLAGRLIRRPATVARHIGGLGSELTRVVTGNSELAPAKSDRRFADPAWHGSWLFRRMMQSYLAMAGTVDDVIADASLGWQAERQLRFTVGNVLDAIAPTNVPLTNPTVLKETIDRGGANITKGGRRLIRDVSQRRLPAMVDTSKFEIGGNLAVSAGSIVLHTEVFELIQYQPRTEQVYARPVVLVPPTINKYYVLDLAPGRSLVEYLLDQGHQVFMVSWRNPDREQGHFDLDTYATSVLEARDAAAHITKQNEVNLMAACSGGIISSGVLGHLAAEGRLGEVSSLTLLVCALDNARAGTTAAFTTPEVAAAAIGESARRGYLDGEALANVFAWLRPNDLIWNYVINNYFLGRELPAFDILYWNQDTVRLAAGLHRDFVMLALRNTIAQPGELTVLGTAVDLSNVDVDTYIVAGSNDHIVPWRNAYASTQLFGGQNTFILSTSGHIQALINPPHADSRSSYRVAEENPVDAEEWIQGAVTKRGSWWPNHVAWLSERSGERVSAPRKLGDRSFKAMAKAPGTYVLAS